MTGGLESELDPELAEALEPDASERLYVYSRATGGWFIPAAPPSAYGLPPGFNPPPYDFTQLAITQLAVYWKGWEQGTVSKRNLLGRTKIEHQWTKRPCSLKITDIDSVVVSRNGFDPRYADEIGIERAQHLALELNCGERRQAFYNWSSNSADVMGDMVALFSQLGVEVEDEAGIR